MRGWTDEQVTQLKELCNLNKYFMNEIGEKIGKSPQAVRWGAHKLGVWSKPVGRQGEKNIKHKHIQYEVMKYFLTHSQKETEEHFKLTPSNFCSLFTNSYKNPKFKHLRKDKRNHSSWSDQDWIFMVRYSGVMPREWIARKLKRGNTYNSVKDALAKFRGFGKYMNGAPARWFDGILDKSIIDELSIKTKAGPFSSLGDFRYCLIPWVTFERVVSQYNFDKKVIIAVESLARFQCFIHGTQDEQTIRRRILKVVGEI